MRIKSIIGAMVAACAMLLGSVFIGVPAASAHQASPTSAWYCGAHRDSGDDLLLHSAPRYLDVNVTIYTCKADDPVTDTYTYNVWVSNSDGSSVGTQYQDCSLQCDTWSGL